MSDSVDYDTDLYTIIAQNDTGLYRYTIVAMPRTPDVEARRNILATAADLFFREGYRAVGVDAIAEQSGVAKMTLYRHFSSKDDLIVAFLEDAHAGFEAWFDGAIAPAAGDPKRQLLALFDALVALCKSPACHGCAFINASAEFPAADHPGHAAALAHKRAIRERLRGLAQAAGASDPEALAAQLALLMDGAFAAVRMYGRTSASPAREAARAARTLLEAQLPGSRRTRAGAK